MTSPQPSASTGRSLARAEVDGDGLERELQAMVASARAVVGMDLAFLGRLDGPLLNLTHVDTDATDPVVRAGDTLRWVDSYCARLLSGAITPTVADVRRDPALSGLSITDDLGLRAYCGVPVLLPDGRLYGTLCAVSTSGPQSADAGQMASLRLIADLLALRLSVHVEAAEPRAARTAVVRRFLEGPGRSVVLQPIVELSTDVVVGYEALCRFDDHPGGAMPPDGVFVEAQELELGVDLELAALGTALSLLPSLSAELFLSVNVSPAALMDPRATTVLRAAPLTRLVLELTEHDPVADYPALLEVLEPLRALGMRLAVDDAGAGFASLRHISALKPDLVKLDISFVRDLGGDPVYQAAARSIADLSRAIGATTIAEGIETEAERAAVAELGVTLGQGYLLGRPLPPA